MQKKVRGDHAPNFFLFAKPAVQNSHIQPGGFLAKMNGQ